MARLTPPEIYELETFSGISGLSGFAEEALRQATVLLETFTCLEAYPDAGTVDYDIVSNAICDMALALFLSQPHLPARFSPYQSESIGSYSYSRASSLIQQGLPTNVGWFDRALQLFACDDDNSVGVYSDAVTIFENDNLYRNTQTNRRVVLGPKDLDTVPEVF